MLTPKDLTGKSKTVARFLKSFVPEFFLIVCLSATVFLILKLTVSQAENTQITVDRTALTNVEYQKVVSAVQNVDTPSYLQTNLASVQKNIATLPWVDEVSIARSWHSGIIVKVLPKKAVARFGSEKLVNAAGEVYYPAELNQLENAQLITLHGPADKSMTIMKKMQYVNEAFAPLNMAVSDVTLTPRMTWIIRFESGFRILVDGENTAYKIFNASEVLKNQMSSKRDEIASIDLRYKNGFAVTWK